MNKRRDDPDGTYKRLIEAAGEVFAEKGFERATVREICKRADANVAAVNYHFRDKEELYYAVFKQAHCNSIDEMAAAVTGAANLRPRERLQVYVKSFLQRLLDDCKPSWMARLMAHEMISPTGALDVVVRDSLRPQFDRLQAIVRAILGAEATDKDVRYFSSCVISQILFWKQSQQVIRRLYEDTYDGEHVARISAYITEFSFAALETLRRRKMGVFSDSKKRRGRTTTTERKRLQPRSVAVGHHG